MKLKELIQEDNGRLSHTKLWSNIGAFSATVAFFYFLYKDTLTVEFLGVYLGALVLQRASSKLIGRSRSISQTNNLNTRESIGL